MQEFVDTAKALSDPNRIRIVAALKKSELCVCQIVELLGLAPSTVSKHMSILRQARLVESRKQGRWVHYRRAGGRVSAIAAAAITWCDDSLAGDATLRSDATRLKRIMNPPLEELCRT